MDHPDGEPHEHEVDKRVNCLASYQECHGVGARARDGRVPQSRDRSANKPVGNVGAYGPTHLHKSDNIDAYDEGFVGLEDPVIEKEKAELREELLGAELRRHHVAGLYALIWRQNLESFAERDLKLTLVNMTSLSGGSSYTSLPFNRANTADQYPLINLGRLHEREYR